MNLVKSTPASALRTHLPVICALLALGAGAAPVRAQAPNPTSAANPFFGSVLAHPATGDVLKLSLDDAVRMGLENNLGLKEAQNDEKSIQGQKNVALQNFLPTVTIAGSVGVHQQNLAALGFGPGVISQFASLFPGGKMPGGVSLITRDDLTEGKIQFGQMLFSGPVIAAWKAAGAAQNAAHFATTSARGEVVQQVASAYLHAIAAASEVDDALALEASDKLLLSQAHDAHVAGVASNLDELRARVQLQAQQQALIAAQNAVEKDLILLKREIGVDPGQKVVLTDPAPYAELAAQTPDEVRAVAYQNRQDYQKLQNQAVELKAVQLAYRSQRLPSLSFGGFWAMSHVNDAGTRGNFVAQGNLSVPLFREAGLRGDVDTAVAQSNGVNAQLADLRNQIDLQVRSALLDVEATTKLTEVARSNVELATRTVADETDRVNAGVDDNLPLVEAQSTLAAAQNNLVESLYQYNLAKLALARASGILEQQYRVYLGW
jgi:outer membrane protein TolC